MDKHELIGRLTRDAVRRQSKKGGEDFLTFTVAVNKSKDVTYFYDVLANISHRIEGMIPYMTKGTAVYVSGNFSYDVYTKKDNTTGVQLNITADCVEFLNVGGKKEEDSDDAAPQKSAPSDEAPKPKKPAKKTAEPDEDMVVKKPAAAVEESADDLPF